MQFTNMATLERSDLGSELKRLKLELHGLEYRFETTRRRLRHLTAAALGLGALSLGLAFVAILPYVPNRASQQMPAVLDEVAGFLLVFAVTGLARVMSNIRFTSGLLDRQGALRVRAEWLVEEGYRELDPEGRPVVHE